MYGNVDPAGLRKDLMWMDRAGIGGFHYFDAGLATPSVVNPRVQYMSDRWGKALHTALELADSLGMTTSVAASPGWSLTGGPWVTKEDAQKKIVWRDTLVTGGRRVRVRLPEPYSSCGPYQNIAAYPGDPYKYKWYNDICVIAMRVRPDSGQGSADACRLSCSDASFPLEVLRDSDLETCPTLSPDATGHGWVCADFGRPVRIRSLSVIDRAGNDFALESSDDGVSWTEVMARIPLSVIYVRWVKASMGIVDIPEVNARYLRLRTLRKGSSMKLADLRFFSSPRLDQVMDKAGFTTTCELADRYVTPEDAQAVSLSDIVDITDRCHGGMLNWRAPRGTWKIYRFGTSLTGIENGPESPEATGLEIDKLDADVVRRYYAEYFGRIESIAGVELGKDIHGLVVDSYESGKGTWTPKMESEFESRRGYALRKWLPVIAGEIVGSAALSEQFLYDWRATLGELIAENHYGILREILGPYGMISHVETHENGTAYVGDGMMCKKDADAPMAALWVRGTVHSCDYAAEADIRESSSVAHVYGGKLCAGESFSINGNPGSATPGFCSGPFMMKAVADGAMAQGLNEFVIHSSVHQPDDRLKPGVTLGNFGQWFNRQETWAELARPWTDYLARSSFMLRQGRWVADIAWFYGEYGNVTGIYRDRPVPVPEGWNFDFVNADILLNVIKLQDCCMLTESGMRYKVLRIDPEVRSMSIAVLRRLGQIAESGVVVCGPKPLRKAGMDGSDEEFRSLVERVWSMPNVFDGKLEEALCMAAVEPDVTGLEPGMKYVHRSLDGGHIYWIANPTLTPREVTLSLRTSGRKPMVWHADTAVIEECSYAIRDGRTEVKLKLDPDDAQFVVLTDLARLESLELFPLEERGEQPVCGPWTLSFQEGRGAPESLVTDELKSLTEFPEEGVRFFSGTVSYNTEFQIDTLDESTVVRLDLGEVHHMVELFVNGCDAGLLWKLPYLSSDISKLLHEGVNTLELRVTGSWANRVIGDQRKPMSERITYTSRKFYGPSDEPQPSGLVGPVVLRRYSY